MKEVIIAGHSIISPLGFSTSENIDNIINGKSGITQTEYMPEYGRSIWASLISREIINSRFSEIDNPAKFTKLEKMMILSIKQALSEISLNIKNENTLLIISTTKGNIDILEGAYKNLIPDDRKYLWKISEVIKEYFDLKNSPMLISTACTSGLAAIITGARYIETERYENVIVAGGDIISDFVISGFNSLHALGEEACKPFDKDRTGLSLGEACGTILLSAQNEDHTDNNTIQFVSGYTSNDANHISAPSRDGKGLIQVIDKTLEKAEEKQTTQIDFISAHGTATSYNDETEALAINAAGLADVPVNSFKGFWGHTLGAAGIIESIASIESIKRNILIPSRGFVTSGVSKPVNVITAFENKEINTALKICSGFGGFNAAAVFRRGAGC